MKDPTTPPSTNISTQDSTDAHPDPVSEPVASGDADAARELALLLAEAGLSCAVNPYEPTSVIVALLEHTVAPYAKEAAGPDEEREEVVPSVTLTARARGNSKEIRRWEGRLEDLKDLNDPALVTLWTWRQHSAQDLAWVAESITATLTILRTGAGTYLQSREHDRKTAANVRRDSAEVLARALHPANTTVTSYSTHVDVHFRTDDGASGTIQIHGPQDARIAIAHIGVERLTLLANVLSQRAPSRPPS
jgi:hypothetical protein